MSTQPEPAPEQTPISAQLVKTLRERTSAGFSDCRAALQESKGDLEAATNILRKKGQAAAQKKAQRQASEGAIGSYIHAGGRIGVLVEVNCESDFVARTNEFQHLCHELAMHVAALDPRFVRREEIPSEVLEQKREAYRAEARAMGKPDHILEKIVAGKLEKFYEESCLYEQHFIKDETLTIREMIEQMVAKVGENITLRRFARFKVGEGSGAVDPAEVSAGAAGGPDPSAAPAAAPESPLPERGKPGAASAEN
jgi:elongation factor Ts